MGYQMWCEAVRSSILATAWLLVLFFAVFYVPLCSDVKSSRPKWPRGQMFVLGLSLKVAISYEWSFGTEPLFISVFGDEP